jgi:uncharacterized protein (TIGR02246 family)
MTKRLGIEEVAAAFAAAWNRHDMPALGALFSEDANFVNVVGMWWRSRAEIEAAHTHTHASIFRDSRLDIGATSVMHLRPGVAAVHATWELTGHTEPDGRPGTPRQGILLFVLTEEAEGWRIRVAQNTDIVPGVLAPPGRS